LALTERFRWSLPWLRMAIFGTLLGGVLSLYGQVTTLRVEFREARDLLRVAEVERSTSLSLAQIGTLRGEVAGRMGRVEETGEWAPPPAGLGFAILLSPRCPFSMGLLRHVAGWAEGRHWPAERILLAALAGDASSAEPWLDLFEPEAPVSVMLTPSHASRRLVVPAVPAVLIWRDGTLIDILVGDGRSSELARYLEVLET
jgi:hypothetical protein